MQFELSKEFLETIELAIQNSNLEWLKDHVLSLHDADIVSILDELAFEPASFLYHLLGEEIQGDVLMELDEDLRETLICVPRLRFSTVFLFAALLFFPALLFPALPFPALPFPPFTPREEEHNEKSYS